jgi:hypothetical protein
LRFGLAGFNFAHRYKTDSFCGDFPATRENHHLRGKPLTSSPAGYEQLFNQLFNMKATKKLVFGEAG